MTLAWLLLLAAELRFEPPATVRAAGLTGGSLVVSLDTEGAPAMLGATRVEGSDTLFTPRFAFQPGLRYRAAWTPAAGSPQVIRFTLPALPLTPVTRVEAVFPSAEQVPENLLKVYVQFSGPMSRGEAYRRVRLRDAAGQPVPLAFLELEEELWDPSLRRLTLLIDPGRIKRGVRPLEEVGPALRAGQPYSVEVDAAWQDAEGRPLLTAFRKTWLVTPADRTAIDPARWTITVPREATRDPLVIGFGEPLDRALAERMLQVTTAAGKPVAGAIAVNDGETRWRFIPAQPWPPGPHRLRVNAALEDLAGNRVGRLFDVDRFDRVDRQVASDFVTREFVIAPAR